MKKEIAPKLIKLFESLSDLPKPPENSHTKSFEDVAKDIVFLMRLRMQEKGIQVPDALQYLGERFSAKYNKPGVLIQKIIQSAILSPAEVHSTVFPHLGLKLEKPKTEEELLLIDDLILAKMGDLSTDEIDSRINRYFFEKPDNSK